MLDADGRRVVDIALPNQTLESVVSALEAAMTTKPVERFVLTGKNLEPLAETLYEMSDENDDLNVVDGSEDRVEVWAPKGTFTPKSLEALVKETGSVGAISDPVPVTLTAKDAAALKKVSEVPGVWFEDGARAWVCRALLHPKLFSSVGVETGLETKRLTFEKFPEERQARSVLMTPLDELGVLHVISNVSDNAIEVVGTKGKVDFDKVRARIESIIEEADETDDDEG